MTRRQILTDFLLEIRGRMATPDIATHHSRSWKDSWSHLDSIITRKDIELERVRVLTDDIFPMGHSSHFPVEYIINIESQKRRLKKEKEEANPWPWNSYKRTVWKNVDKQTYREVSEWLVSQAVANSEGMPWEVKYKIINESMAEAAYLATMDKKVHECSKEVELKKKIVYEGFKRKKIAKELRRLGKEKSMNVPLLRRKKHWKKSGS